MNFTILVHLKSGLIKGVDIGESGFIRGVDFGESGFIRGVDFGESGFIRGGLLYKNPRKISHNSSKYHTYHHHQQTICFYFPWDLYLQ